MTVEKPKYNTKGYLLALISLLVSIGNIVAGNMAWSILFALFSGILLLILLIEFVSSKFNKNK